MKHLTLALALLAVPAAAHAQMFDLSKRPSCPPFSLSDPMLLEVCNCARISDHLERLSCYDQAADGIGRAVDSVYSRARGLASTRNGIAAMQRALSDAASLADGQAVADSLAESEKGRQAMRAALENHGN